MIDRSTIARVMDAADIVDVVREFVTLRKAGVNYKGLCPFHNEKTPSFVVSPAKQLCKCFSCGKGGDVAHFLMEIEQLSYPEAIKWLGRKYGIEVREKELTDEEKQSQSVRESMFVVNEWARDYFVDILHNQVDGVAIGMSYFRMRGLHEDIIRRFELGYSLDKRTGLAEEALKKGFNEEYLVKTGLCFKTDDGRLLDRYHGRVIFPIHSVSGKVVAFGGRILSNDKKLAKYVNSPESEIYNKSRELYGLYLSKKAIVRENRCYMVEGYMDVISMHQNGVENVVASSGTSLTNGQIRLLHRFTNNITVLYDGDAAGIHASLRGIDMLLSEGMNVKVLLLPDGDDPDSFSQKHPGEAFKKYIAEHETDFITFKTNLLMKDVKNDPIKKADVVKDIVQSISVIPEGIVRQTFAHECASMLSVDEALILNEISKIRRAKANRPQENAENPSAETSSQQALTQENKAEAMILPDNSDVFQEEKWLLQQIIRHGERVLTDEENEAGEHIVQTVAEYILSDMASDDLQFSSEQYRQIANETLEHIQEPDFKALPYFMHHPDAEISSLAIALGSDKEQLSKKQQQMYGDEADHLVEIVPRLLHDFKFAIVRHEMKQIEKQLQAAATDNDLAACHSLMERYKQLSEIFAVISKVTGDRVVTHRLN